MKRLLQQSQWVHLALLSVTLIYGFYYVSIKLLLHELTDFQLVFLRLVITALVVGLIECFVIKTRFQSFKDLAKLAILSLIGIFGVQFLVVVGTKQTSVFHSSLLMATIPIQTLLFSLIIGRERFSVRKAVGIGIAFSGVALLLLNRYPGEPFARSSLTGDCIILLTAFLYSIFLVLSEPLVKQYHSFSFMAYCYLVAGIATLTGFNFNHLSPDKSLSLAFVHNLSMNGWLLMAYMVVFASIITYTLNNYALTHTRPSTVAAYIFLQPLISAILGYWILHEPFTSTMAAAGVIIFGGMWLARSNATNAIPEEAGIEMLKP